MSILIHIEMQGAEESHEMLREINNKLPVILANKFRKCANNIYADLLKEMDLKFKAPRGNLKEKTILVHKGFLHYDIEGPDYNVYVDKGTSPHKVSGVKHKNLFKPWQKRTGFRSLATSITLKGTKGKGHLTTTKEQHAPKRADLFIDEFFSELRKTAKQKGGI